MATLFLPGWLVRETKRSAGKKEEKRKSAGGDKDKERGGGNDSFKSREFIETSEESSSDSDHKSKSKKKKKKKVMRVEQLSGYGKKLVFALEKSKDQSRLGGSVQIMYSYFCFFLTRTLTKKRRKLCPPLPAQRRNLTELLHTGPNLVSVLINGLTHKSNF